jgi:CheY-like chemotaxis protein
MSYILIIDDNKLVSACVALELKGENFRVKTAENGKIALSMLEVSTPDVIICDVRMPVMDGLTFVRIIKSWDAMRHIPVIIYTSMPEEKEQQVFKNLGVTNYHFKGCDSSILIQSIKQSLNKKNKNEN